MQARHARAGLEGVVGTVVGLLLFVAGCGESGGGGAPANTATPIPTATATRLPSSTATPSNSATPSLTPTRTVPPPTLTPTATATFTVTAPPHTATPSLTSTATSEPPTATPTATASPSDTATASPTAPETATATATQTSAAGIGAVFRASLSGDQETPPVDTGASGEAELTLSADETTLSYQLSVTGIATDQILAAHIHVALPGKPGAVVLNLHIGSFTSPLSGTLSAADFMPDAADGVNSFADFVAALRAGETYVNVHTQANQGGEIRGQIGAAAILRANLSGDQETPPVTTTASGHAVFILNPDEASLSYQLTVTGLTPDQILAAHIHVAPPGVPGPIIFNLHIGSFSSPLFGTLTAADFNADAADGVNTFADAVAKLRTGQAYVNVHTQANQGGEIRGQIGLANTFHASLSGDQETGPVDTAGTGSATFTLSADETMLAYELNVTGIAADQILAAHIHLAPPGTPGPIVFNLHLGSFTSPLSGTLTAADFMPDPADGVNTLADFVTKLRAGQTYVNVHTTTNQGGEIRGQIGAAAIVRAALSGDQETPPVTTTARGDALFILSPDEGTLAYQLRVTGIAADQILAAHVHVAVAGVPGPIIFNLHIGSFTSPLSGTLTAADLNPDAPDGVNSFADAVAKLRAGRAYVNVHTQTNQGGEIRGQIGVAALLRATLTGDQETGPVVTTAGGTAVLALNPDETSLSYQLTVSGLAADQILAAHIHVAPPGTPGPIIFNLHLGSFASPLSGTLTAADFNPDAADGVNSFADAVAKLRSGQAYVNVHTMTHQGGEIRGQIELSITGPLVEEFIARANAFECFTNQLGHLAAVLHG